MDASFRGETDGPPQSIGGSGKARGLPVLVEGMIGDERMAGWMSDEKVRG